MKSKLKYFLFNKERDFSRGFGEGVAWDQESIWLQESAGGELSRGVYFTRILDSLEKSMEWHRLVFDTENQQSTPYIITIYAADQLEFTSGGKQKQVETLLKDPNLDVEEKLRELEPFVQKRIYDHRDILLHEVKGRYLWIGFELYRQGRISIRMKNIRVYFPKQSWISYLPEVYQASDKDQFLERYLAIFQTLYEDLNQEIGQIHRLFDMDTTEREFLVWLADWLDIAGSYMWSEQQLRSLLREAVALYKKRGTREGMLTLIRLYTGRDAYLVEYMDVKAYMGEHSQKTILTRLYGLNPYILTIVLKKEDVPTQKEYRALTRVIEEMMPAQMELNLVILEPYMFLGDHIYLGINSCLGAYRSLALDGLSMTPFSVIQNEPTA